MCIAELTANATQEINPQTRMVRDQYEADMVRRFKWLSKQIKTKIIDKEFLGGSLVTNAYTYPLMADKLEAFKVWLIEQEDKGILEIVRYEGRSTVVHTGWQETYVKRSYSKGVVWAEKRMEELGIPVPEPGAIGATLGGAVHADALSMMYSRNFTELKGITEAMDQQISRVLADGMASGMNPRVIARDIVNRVDNVGIARARTLARTETARAFDEATLNRYTDFRVEEVEWIYSGGNCPSNVCPEGNGTILKTSEAHGVLPAHPNCECAWGPVV